MDTTDRRTLWTAGLVGSVLVLGLIAALITGGIAGGFCW